MILTAFCAAMLLAFLICLIATGSAYVLFGAVLFVFLLTGILRRPIPYSKNRWIFVFYQFTLRVVPATETITGNPNQIVFYRHDRTKKHSMIAVNAGEEQIVSGMSLYSYKGHALFVLFPVPAFLHAVWQANAFFACVTAAALTAFAAVGFFPYQRLRHTDALLSQTANVTVGHADSEDVIADPVSDNVLLLCRDPENGIDLMELLCFRHSNSQVMPLYLNPGLYTEIEPGQYTTPHAFAKSHSLPELTAMIEQAYCLHISDVVSLQYDGLCQAVDAAGGLQLQIRPDALANTAAWLEANSLPALPAPGENGLTVCNWQQMRGFLHCDDAVPGFDVTARALRQCSVTNQLLTLFQEINAGDLQLADQQAAEISFSSERLYKLTEMLRSDHRHYADSYDACTAPDRIGTYCLPRAGHFRQMQDGIVYAAPGVIRQYVIRLMYY